MTTLTTIQYNLLFVNIMTKEKIAKKTLLDIVGQNVSTLRRTQGISQDKLADLAQLSRTAISQIEAGKGDPRLSTLMALSEALKITPQSLFYEQQITSEEYILQEAMKEVSTVAEASSGPVIGLPVGSAIGFSGGALAGIGILGGLLAKLVRDEVSKQVGSTPDRKTPEEINPTQNKLPIYRE